MQSLDRVEAERDHYRRPLATVNAIREAHTPAQSDEPTAKQCYRRYWSSRGIEEADWDDISGGEYDGWEAVAALLRGGWTCPAGVTVDSLSRLMYDTYCDPDSTVLEMCKIHLRAVLRHLGIDGQVPEE